MANLLLEGEAEITAITEQRQMLRVELFGLAKYLLKNSIKFKENKVNNKVKDKYILLEKACRWITM